MLERASQIAILVVAVVFIAAKAYDFNRPAVPTQTPNYKAGDRVDPVALGTDKARLTLVMATASTCRYCTQSLDFYSKLTKKAGELGVRVVGVTSEDIATNAKYLSDAKVSVAEVVGSADTKLRIRGTPTLLLLRANGEVVQAWHGKLTPESEAQVVGTLVK
jgi:peroxiredoxin